jgi:hypothetical protein
MMFDITVDMMPASLLTLAGYLLILVLIIKAIQVGNWFQNL